MTVNLAFIGGAGWQFFNDSGNPLSGGKLYTYAAGTTTPLTTYTSFTGLVPNTNPIILDAAGRTPEQIWATEGLLYKYVVTTSTNTLIRTWDNIGGSIVASDLALDLASTTDNTKGDALIGFRQSNASGFLTSAVGRTVNNKLQEVFSAKDFGAVGDGVADDTAAIQAAINAAIYNNSTAQANAPKRKVVIPAGLYRITDTIHLGYGTSFTSVFVEGEGMRYRCESSFNGTGIIADFNDRPAFNFQGARSSSISNLWILGKMFAYVNDNNLGGLNGASNGIDDTVAANWVDPAFPASASSRYAPYTAITVDAYSGTAPAVSYPSVTYPAFLGSVAQYNKTFSTDVLIDNVGITGFVVGVANQPCDADGNGDFTVVRRVNMDCVQYGISVCNTQSRNFAIDNVKMGKFFCAITTQTHGRRQGKLNGTISNLSMGQGINLLDISLAFATPLTILHLYCEAQWRIGTVTGTAASNKALIFQSCQFDLGSQNDNGPRGRPAYLIEGGQQAAAIKFIGCFISGFPSVVNLGIGAVLEDTQVFSTERRDAPILPYQAYAHNALAGGVYLQPVPGGPQQRIKYTQFNLNTGAFAPPPVNTFSEEYFSSSSRVTCLPLYVRLATNNGDLNNPYYVPFRQTAVPKTSGIVSSSITGRTLQIEFTARTASTFAYAGPDVGDILVDEVTQTVFFVRSRTGQIILADAQTNIKSDGLGSYVFITPINLTSGNYYSLCTRFYSPTLYLRGDVTTGSAILTSCATDEPYALWYDAEISVNDWLYVDTQSNNFVPRANTQVTARDQTAGTITLAGNATRSITRQRLTMFIRTPAPNA